MPKNFFQDMVKIKNDEKEKLKKEVQVSIQPSPVKETPVSKSFVKNKFASVYDRVETPNNGKKSKRRLWFVAVISLVFFLFAFSNLFLKVVVTVNPQMKDVSLNKNLSASLDRGGALPFDLIVIFGEENKIVETTGQKDVSEKAKGIVVIYNNFSSATQRLDIDTRLEGSNGKIYKTQKQIVLPGMKDGVPGSVEVGILAAEAGEEYNSGPLDFKIFGFKGTPKYSKFYARSKDEVSGGFNGKASIIPPVERLAIINDLKTNLHEKLFKKATDQIPSGFILFKDAVFLETNEDSVDFILPYENTLTIKLEGTLYGFLLNEESLTKRIAESNIDEYDGNPVYLPDIRDLTFSLSNKNNILFKDVKNIDFNLQGTTKIFWKLDESKLVADLLGKSKKDFNKILLKYPNIDSAHLSISPFWKRSLPLDSEDIKMIVNYPE